MRRTAVLLAAAAAALVPLALMVTPPATAAPRTAGTPEPVSLGVSSIQPLVLTAGGRLQISGVLTNGGTQDLDNLSIQLVLSTSPVTSRSALAALASTGSRPPGSLVPGALIRPVAPLVVGGTLPWSFSITAAALHLGSPGVYPMAVEVFADDPLTGGRTRFGTARTFLPWDLGGAKPTRVAVVWPVLGTPSRDSAGQPIGTSITEQLDGRLKGLLDAAGGGHLTWLLDGDTLESVRQLADSGTTGTGTTGPTQTPSTGTSGSGGPTPSTAPSGSPTPSTGPSTDPEAIAAQDWLDLLKSAVSTGEVEAVPFGDPDLVAAVRAGRTQDVAAATTLSSQVVSAVLDGSTPVGDDLAWPAEGTADSRTLAALAGIGAKAVLLAGPYAPTARPITTYTPSGVGPVTGSTLTGVVGDAELSSLVATPTQQLGGPALAQQRVLAELAMITAELPSVQRSVVIVPPRRWTPDATYLHGLLDAFSHVPWVQPATLADLRVAAAAGPVRARPTYPITVRRREIGSDQFDLVSSGQTQLAALSGIASNAAAFRDGYLRALLRSESTVWRTHPASGLAYTRGVDAAIDHSVSSVRVVASGGLTLAARSGKIPVTVENGLGQTVTVRLSVAADPAVRLTLTQPAAEQIPAGQSRTFEVPAEATTNGDVVLMVSLLTPAGSPYGSTVMFPVQITGFGEVAQVVVGAAFVLLAVALVFRVVRAIRRGRRPGSASSVRELVR